MSSKCKKCKFHKCANSIGMWGKKASRKAKPRIMIIQQAPSRLDDRYDELLAGDGGEKLNWFLEQSGIDFNDVYFTSAVKCKPEKTSDIKKPQIKACEPYLIEEIIEVKPEIIICMGKAGFQSLLGYTSVYNFRGHIQDFSMKYDAIESDTVLDFKCKVMPTFDLHGAFTKWEYNDDIIRDFKKVQKYVETKIIDRTPEPEVNLILSLEALDEWVERYKTVKFAATDYETTGLDFWKNLPFNAGYCSEEGKADVLFILPYKNEHTEKWTIEDKKMAKKINDFVKPNQARILQAMREVHGGDTHWILHNGKFDGKFGMKLKVPYKRFWFDTMNADPLIDENLGHSLNIACERRGINFGAYDTLLWKYTNKEEKNKKTYQYVPPDMIVNYLGIDVDACMRLFKKVYKELIDENLLDRFLKVKMQTVRDVMRSEYIGFMADRPLIEEAGKIIEGKMDEAQKALEDFTGIDKFNVNSPKQMNEFMVGMNYPLDKAGLKVNKTGYSTAGEELEKLKSYKKNRCNEFPSLVKEFKTMSKIKGTYVDGKYKAESERGEELDADLGGMLKHIDKNGRIHTTYNLHSPITGRESSSSPSVQVWPRPIEGLINCRNFVVPTNKDWCLFEADYCLHGDTKIRLASGKDVPVRELVGLEKFHVYAKNMKTGKIDIAEAGNARITRRVNKTLEITLNTGKKIRCTDNHKFLKHSETDFTEAKNLNVGDGLTSARFFINNGEYKKFNINKKPNSQEEISSLIRINHKITSIKVIEEEIDVYCITVPEYENFYLSNGVLSHNCAVEINIVAYLSKDPVLLEQLRIGTDLHCFNAVNIGGFLNMLPSWVKYEHMMIMNGKEPDIKDKTKEEIQKYKDEIEDNDPDHKLLWKELRTRAKSLAFGLNYGKEAFSFAEEFEISEEEAQAMIDGYFATYKVMKAWRDSIVDHALDYGYVESTLSGRKRRFYGATEWIYSDRGQECKWSTNKTEAEISRQAMNFPVQHGAHTVFEPALIRLNKRFRKEGLKARVMFRIHDGILGECPKSERLIVNKCMVEELPFLLGAGTDTELKLKVDTDYYKWEWYGEKIKLD